MTGLTQNIFQWIVNIYFACFFPWQWQERGILWAPENCCINSDFISHLFESKEQPMLSQIQVNLFVYSPIHVQKDFPMEICEVGG